MLPFLLTFGGVSEAMIWADLGGIYADFTEFWGVLTDFGLRTWLF
jgi:hypothetical protein